MTLDQVNARNWPPPTLGKGADELAKLKLIALQFLEHLKIALPEACGKEGHIWNYPEGKRTSKEGETWVPSETSERWGAGHAETYHYEVYARKCTRCDYYQELSPKEQMLNPFTGAPTP